MKKLLWLGFVTASLLLVPASAGAWCICGPDIPPIHVDAGCKWHFHVWCGGCPSQLEPWYLYYPYEAHFQSAAPVGFPNWPSPVVAGAPVPSAAPTGPAAPTPPGSPAPPAAPMAPVPPMGPAMPSAWRQPMAPAGIQPAGFVQPMGYAGPQVPSYWYERR
jgi:hypothetical protein